MFSPVAIRAHVAFLADDLLAGREPGTPGYDVAARYVASQFEALGLQPAGEDGHWYQEVPLQESSLGEAGASLGIGEARWANGTNVIVSPSQLETRLEIEAPVVFVGFGLDAPAQGFEDYRGLDVRGKLVAYLIGTPPGTPSELGAHLAAEKSKMAEQQGAVGVIALETRRARELFPWKRRLETDMLPAVTWIGSDDRPYLHAPRIRVAAALDETATKALFARAQRSYDAVLDEAEPEGARPEGFALATRVHIAAESRLRRFGSPNVLGMIPGSDPRLKDEFVLMMAHLDHIGTRPAKPGEKAGADRIFNGATDNAMGISIMLEVARVISSSGQRPRRSILFFANAAEEKGLLGVDYFAHRPTVPLARIAGVVNLDMPLLTHDFVDVIAFGAEHSTLGAHVARAAALSGVALTPDPMPEQGIFTRSDHYALVRQGVPAVFLATGQGGQGKQAWDTFLTKHYHQPSDDMTLPFDWDAVARFARINGDLLTAIANDDERARWHEGDFFAKTFGAVRSTAATPVTVVMTEGTNMSAAVSPDGKTIVASIQGTLWSMPATGGKATALTAPELDAQEPAWSPDGKLVAFYAFTDDTWSVWTIAPDGSGLAKRSAGPGDARYPSFSADGKSLLYSTDGNGYSAVSLELASGAVTRLVEARDAGYAAPTAAWFQKAGNVVYPILSPDGSKLAYIVDGVADTLHVHALAGGAPKALHTSETLGAPAWSPDGKGLYVVGISSKSSSLTFVPLDGSRPVTVSAAGDIFPFRPSATADAVTVTADGRIRTFPARGGEAKDTPFEAAVTFARSPYKRRAYDFKDATPRKALGIFDPALSPDGSQAVFTAVGDLWLAHLATGAVSKITDDEAIDLSPSWSPDGAQIAFASDRGGKTDIWTMALHGRELAKLTDLDTPANSPVWSPDGRKIAFLKDSRASIFLAGTVEVLDVGTKKITRIAEEIFGPSAPSWSPTGRTVAVVARKPLTSRFREGINAFMLLPADGTGAAKWVSPVAGKSLGRRQWNRPAWSASGDIVYRIDDQLWSVPLDDDGKLGASALMIAKSGENPSWSADGSKLIFVDGDKLNTWDAASGMLATSSAAAMWTRAIPNTRYTIRAGRLFDGRGDAYQTNIDVVVERNVITSIRPAGSGPVVGTLIDASTQTLLPGLIESHTHQSTSLGRALGRRWLRHGITSVRETGADPYEAVERREAEASGRRPGPRVFTAGPLNEGGRVSYGISETVGTVDLARSAVARSTALGLDLLKSYVREDYTVQKTIIAEAHASGIPVSGHELYPALANGADQMEHVGGTSRRGFSTKISRLDHTYQDVVALIAQSGMSITPTLALHSGNGTQPIPSIQKTVKAIVDAGGRVAAGVDSPFVTFADSLHVELRLYVEAGITPAHVLRLATSEAAVSLGIDSQLGSVEPGKIADLVLVDGDPLADITDTTKITWVMKNGAVVWEKDRAGAQ